MRSERDAEFWDGFSDTYNSDDQGDAPQRIVDSLMESGAVRPDDCVMEVGSGPGTYSLLLAPRVRILVCMDSSAGMLDRLFASAGGMGITNMERFHKNWSDYTPRKGYDFCFASLLPGSSTDESMRRMEATARRGCAVLAWERLHWDDITAAVSRNLGIDRPGPRRGTEFFEEWLADNRYLSAMITDLAIHINRTELQFFKKYKFQSQSVQGHLRIMEALRQKDLEEAVQATEDNWMLNFHLVIEPCLLKAAQNT